MDFGLTDEQDQLASTERAWLTRNDPLLRIRSALDSAAVTIDPAAVEHAAQSDLLALLTPEMGGSHVDLAVVTEAHGYAASSLPIADLAVTAWLLDSIDLPLAESASTGDALVGLTLAPAADDGGGIRLTGHSKPVPMAPDLDAVAVAGLVGERE